MIFDDDHDDDDDDADDEPLDIGVHNFQTNHKNTTI